MSNDSGGLAAVLNDNKKIRLLTSIFYNFPQNIRSINEAKLSFLWLNLHSVSFKCKINFESVKPLNLEKRRLAKLQKHLMPLTCDFPHANSFS